MSDLKNILDQLKSIDVEAEKDEVLNYFSQAEAPRNQHTNDSSEQETLGKIIMEAERIADEASYLEQFLAFD